MFLLWNGPISWSVKRQNTVAISTTEAEYVGEYNASKEAVYLAEALNSLEYDEYDVQQVKLMADTQAAIMLAHNPANHGHSRDIDIQFHSVRELYLKLGKVPFLRWTKKLSSADPMVVYVAIDTAENVYLTSSRPSRRQQSTTSFKMLQYDYCM